MNNVRKLTMASMLIALGVVLGNIIYIPIGVSKCFPMQHTINIISAIILGPIYSTGIAFLISLIRNIIGTGSLLAFPGSMIGALMAGLIYQGFKNKYLATAGEIFGTGIMGGVAAFYVAKHIMGQEVAGLFFVYPFLLSTVGGAVIAILLLKVIEMTPHGLEWGKENVR